MVEWGFGAENLQYLEMVQDRTKVTTTDRLIGN